METITKRQGRIKGKGKEQKISHRIGFQNKGKRLEKQGEAIGEGKIKGRKGKK